MEKSSTDYAVCIRYVSDTRPGTVHSSLYIQEIVLIIISVIMVLFLFQGTNKKQHLQTVCFADSSHF